MNWKWTSGRTLKPKAWLLTWGLLIQLEGVRWPIWQRLNWYIQTCKIQRNFRPQTLFVLVNEILESLKAKPFLVDYLDPQVCSQMSGSAQPTSSGKSTRAAIPGKTISHNGKSFNQEARIHPPLACPIVFDERALCTITWSEHQYQIELTVRPNKT